MYLTLENFQNKKLSVDERVKLLESVESSNDDEFKLKLITYLLDMSIEKNTTIQTKARTVLKKFLTEINPFLIKMVVTELMEGLKDDKSIKMKTYTIELLNEMSDFSYFNETISHLVEPVSYLLSETSQTLADSSKTLYSKMLEMVNNKDILPLKEALLDGLSDPSHLANTIDKITSTTFVQAVDDKTLSVIVPILTRTFKKSTYAVKRQSIIIIENMTKLVTDELSASEFIIKLLPLMEEAKEEVPDPDVRKVAERVLTHLNDIKNKGTTQAEERQIHLNRIKSFFPQLTKCEEEVLNTMIHTNNLTTENLVEYLHLTEELSHKIFNEFSSSSSNETEDNITYEELCIVEFYVFFCS
jgi:hypothetical protein